MSISRASECRTITILVINKNTYDKEYNHNCVYGMCAERGCTEEKGVFPERE